MGLPYEAEPSVTKHMAHFLMQARHFDPGKKIDYLLFNGGALKAEPFQKALADSLSCWYSGFIPKILESDSFDLAVARGAAYFGKVCRGLGVAVKGVFLVHIISNLN